MEPSAAALHASKELKTAVFSRCRARVAKNLSTAVIQDAAVSVQ